MGKLYMTEFLTCFYILDYCYFRNYENDLGALLGIMSPNLLTDGMPVDEAVLEYYNSVSNKTAYTDEEIINKADEFLRLYENRFGFRLENTRKLIKTAQVLGYVDTAGSRAEQTCKKHGY